MDIQQYVTPGTVAIATGIAGSIVTLVLLILVITNRRAIAKGVASVWQGTFSQVGLFYFGMGLFMLASIVEAGPVLDKISMHGALWGYGGHLLVFAFDMIAAVCLRARLNAKRVFNDRAARLMMWGIWLPAAVSMISNLAGAFQAFQANEFNHLGPVAWILPLVGGVFPSMIVILSLAADNLLDMTAINSKIDPDTFETDEKKRLRILQIRLKSEHDLLEEEEKIEQIRAKRNRAIDQREWFFMRWIRPQRLSSGQQDMTKMMDDFRVQFTQQLDATVQSNSVSTAHIFDILNTLSEQMHNLSSEQQLLTVQLDAHREHLRLFTLQEKVSERVQTVAQSEHVRNTDETPVVQPSRRSPVVRKVNTSHSARKRQQTEKQARKSAQDVVQLVLSKNPDAQPSEIVKLTGLSRTTVYSVLHTLPGYQTVQSEHTKITAKLNGNGHHSESIHSDDLVTLATGNTSNN